MEREIAQWVHHEGSIRSRFRDETQNHAQITCLLNELTYTATNLCFLKIFLRIKFTKEFTQQAQSIHFFLMATNC